MQDENLKLQLSKLKENSKLLRELITTRGFINYYYNNLSKFETRKEAFEFCNDKYYEITGVYRFASIQSFKVICSRFYNKK